MQTLSHFMLIAAAWGYAASWVNEVLKQDHWPKWVNTLVADAVLVITAALATLSESTLTWHNFASALIVAAGAALTNHQFFLAPTGIGPKLKSMTSWAGIGIVAPKNPEDANAAP